MKTLFFRTTLIVITISLLFAGMFFKNVPTSGAQSPSQGWSSPINLSNSGGASKPISVIDSRGVIHVIWLDQFDGYKYVESTDGVNWTSPKTTLYPFSKKVNSDPVFVTNVNGGIQIFWEDKNSALFYAQAQAETIGTPGDWTGTYKLSDSILDFDVITDSRGALHVAYTKSSGTEASPSGIFYRKLDGAGWAPTKTLYSSPYFRSLGLNDAHVRISVADNESNSRTVYVAWDDRPQKRIFLAKSIDAGNSWDDPVQLKGPEDFTGSDLPYNVNVNATNDNVLLLWEAGEPGSRCSQYSQWSIDGGNQFTEPLKMLDESVPCPSNSVFISQNENFSVTLLNIQDDLSLIAWNGSKWSTLQPQTELSVFSNPVTFDNVLFGCQNASLFKETIFVVGCDMGRGGDIWFRSRPLGSLNEWFPPASAWTSPTEITSASQKISSLISIADNKNTVHAFWVQAPLLDIDKANATIQYSRWSDAKWSKPVSILAGFSGIPVQLSATLDAQGKVFLSWAEGENGDLYFSWADVDRAHLASEWSEPQQVPSPSQVSSFPEILVDGTDKIVVAYSVPFNENRGIYIVQSDSFGKSWSPLLSVFDAVAANWDLADQPRMTLSGDGRLHLLFSRSSLRESDQSGGLYYVQSSDGGFTWSKPDVVTERPALWSQIIGFDKQIVHRLWQENNGVTLDVFHQISRNSGKTWENSIKVFNTSDFSAKISLSMDLNGHLYIAQTHMENAGLMVDVSEWDGAHWIAKEKKEITVNADNAQYSTATGITSEGILNVMISITYPELKDGLKNKIITFSRSLGASGEKKSQLPLLLPTPVNTPASIDSSNPQLTPTASSPLANIGDAPSSSRKNLVGLALVGVVVIMIIAIIWPRKKAGSE